MINNKKTYSTKTAEDIARLSLIHSGVLIYDSEICEDGTIRNEPHYGEYVSVWINDKLPAALRCAADYLFRKNNYKNGDADNPYCIWKIKKPYIKYVFEKVLDNVGFYDNKTTAEIEQSKEILAGIFKNNTPSTVDQENVKNYIVNFGYNLVDLIKAYDYKGFEGKSLADIRKLQNENYEDYLKAVNTLFVSIAIKFDHVGYSWDFEEGDNETDFRNFAEKLADTMEKYVKVTKYVLTAA
jgi:hypothetical protein